MKYSLLIFALLCSFSSFAQLGFCTGSKGDPIFHEDFGSGSGTGPELAAGITDYTYVTQDPQDGEYTIADNISRIIQSWHDYLPKTTLSNGRALIVNADYDAGQFFRTQISGLCENTTYEFSAFLMNIYDRASGNCANGGIPVNVRFEIWDETDSELIKAGSTGDITSVSSPKWEQYALTFKTEVGQGSVILKMFNNSDGGCGNDLAIDDILFRSCGDLTTISTEGFSDNEYTVCEENAPVSLKLKATPDNSVYSTHAYQWQESKDDATWNDIAGATSENFTTPALSDSKYYRVKVAEDPVNLDNNLCSSASESFFIHIIKRPEPPVSSGNVEICSNDEIPALRVSVKADEEVNWYDQNNGGTLLGTGSSYTPSSAGIYYAEAVKKDYDCGPGQRTSVKLTIYPSPQAEDEELYLCPGKNLRLDAGIPNIQYEWSTGETNRIISIDQAGNYSVVITSLQGCSTTKNFEIHLADDPEISEVTSEGAKVSIVSGQPGAFEYSLDGVNFQSSNVFNSVPGGIYTAYMRDLAGCNTVTREFPHILAPAFITPNGDGYNDRFEMRGIEYFPSSSIRLFDRYGKLIKEGKGKGFSWDGTLDGKKLPAGDYWYRIYIEDYGELKGHFSLVR